MTDPTERVMLAIAFQYGLDGGARLSDEQFMALTTAAIAAHIADIIEHGPSPEMRAALAGAGLVIVPREPTEADIERIARTICLADDMNPMDSVHTHDEIMVRRWETHQLRARAVYAAIAEK